MILLALLACGTEELETCEVLCDQLYKTCAYGAYPTYESCLQGCAYEQKQGADVEGEAVCMEKAGCDTFAIVECEHKFGLVESE